jgi:hypothetical protein
MLKKNISIILIVLLTLLLLAFVIWMFDKKIETLETKMNHSVTRLSKQNSSLLKINNHLN